jgi:hypothetical protein
MSQPYVVDLSEIRGLVKEITYLIDDLDGVTTDVDYDRGKGRHSDPEQARMSRDLLRLTELCRLMGAEFGQIYWTFKGYEDPRFAK